MSDVDKQGLTEQIAEAVEYVRVLDAAVKDEDLTLVASTAAHLRAELGSVCSFLENGPRAQKDACSSARLALDSTNDVLEQVVSAEPNWSGAGAAATFTMSFVDQLSTDWNKVSRPDS